MEKAYLLVTVRDINLLCQHYKTYAQIEGQTGDERSHEHAGEKVSWKSEQQLVTNGCSP